MVNRSRIELIHLKPINKGQNDKYVSLKCFQVANKEIPIFISILFGIYCSLRTNPIPVHNDGIITFRSAHEHIYYIKKKGRMQLISIRPNSSTQSTGSGHAANILDLARTFLKTAFDVPPAGASLFPMNFLAANAAEFPPRPPPQRLKKKKAEQFAKHRQIIPPNQSPP